MTTRYRAYQLPKSGHWGVWDRNSHRFILGVVAEDYDAAAALAFMLNGEFAKWVATIPVQFRGTLPAGPEPRSVVVPAIFRKGRAGFATSDAPPVVPIEPRRVQLSEYLRRHAPESERQLIARLRA